MTNLTLLPSTPAVVHGKLGDDAGLYGGFALLKEKE